MAFYLAKRAASGSDSLSIHGVTAHSDEKKKVQDNMFLVSIN